MGLWKIRVTTTAALTSYSLFHKKLRALLLRAVWEHFPCWFLGLYGQKGAVLVYGTIRAASAIDRPHQCV